MAFHIDSSEVLHHLNSYGIYSIDDEALKSFIKDLKKLIKYEQYKNLYDATPERKQPLYERNFPDSTTKLDLLNPSIPDNRREKICCRKKDKENMRPIYAEDPSRNKKIHYEEHVRSECPCKNTHSLPPQRSEPSIPSTQKPHCKCKNRLAPADVEKQQPNSYKNKEESHSVTRPISILSYARSQASTVRTKKGHCDPVELYHYYQSFWKNHKLPGENDHAQLRLAIRKRLMNAK